MKKVLDVFDSQKPIFYFSKLFGMTFHKITGRIGDRSVKFCLKQTIFSLLVHSGIIIIFVFGFRESWEFIKNFDPVGRYTEFLQIFTRTTLTICNFLTTIVYRYNYLEILQNFQKLDKYILDQNDYKFLKNKNIKIVTFWILLCILQMSLDMFYIFRGQFWFYWTTYWVPYFVSAITECRLMAVLTGLKFRFKTLNKNFYKEMLVQVDKLLILENTKCIHYKLTEISNVINDIFSIPMLFMTGNSFITIVSSYYSLWAKYKINKDMTIFKFLAETYNTISIGIRVVIIIYNFSSISYEVR